ncbi:Uncharacterised protein [Mycobacteroides abscessus subsp. abscessus]|nr:Uncharacterised protein [Mycobacteroides abscessus subsp. abscessus]
MFWSTVDLLVDPHQTRMIGIATRDGMVFQRPESPGQRHVFGASEVLITQKQHLVFQQQRPDFAEELITARNFGEIDVEQLGAYGAGQRPYPDLAQRGNTIHDIFLSLEGHSEKMG